MLPVGALIALSTAIIPFNSSVAQTKSSCEQAQTGIKNDIENRIGGKVESINQREASDPSSPFANRRDELNISLSNIRGVGRNWKNPANSSQAAKNIAITNSRDLMLAYTRQVISACHQVAKVTFIQGFHPEGIFILSRSGTVVEPICAKRDGNRELLSPLQWGEDLCL